MKNFVKVLVWIIILAAVCFGVYLILPEHPQAVVKSVVQPLIDANAKARIEQVKSLTNRDLNNASYRTILEAKTKNPSWVYEAREEEPGVEYVTFYGRGVSINLKDWSDYQGMLSTSAAVKIEFKITNGSVEILPYIDGKPMYIKDGAHVEQNDKIKLDIFSQLYSGMQTEK